MRKGIYLLPNLFTSFSLFCGFFAVVATFNGEYLKASWAILIASAFDCIDGRIARLTNTASKFGLEYDSLADLISFGIAPGILVYAWALKPFGRWGWLAAFFYVACAALRLARFNIQVHTVESRYFQGIPTPAAACLVATTVMFFYHLGVGEVAKPIAVLMMIYLLSPLMVSSIKFNSFKDLELAKKKPFSVLVVLVFVVILIVAEPPIMLFFLFLFYTLSGPLGALAFLKKKRGKEKIFGEEKDLKLPLS